MNPRHNEAALWREGGGCGETSGCASQSYYTTPGVGRQTPATELTALAQESADLPLVPFPDALAFDFAGVGP